jgi:hypothetical protein
MIVASILGSSCIGGFDLPPRSASQSSARRAEQAPSTRDRPAVVFHPSGPPARVYGLQRPAGALSMLQRRVLAYLAEAARRHGVPRLENDGTANALARDLCGSDFSGAPPWTVYELAMRHHGLIDPPPRVLAYELPDGNGELQNLRRPLRLRHRSQYLEDRCCCPRR